MKTAVRGIVNASVEEYMTMVAAGLVGSTPHMISATITAISRLLFEFKGNRALNRSPPISTDTLIS